MPSVEPTLFWLYVLLGPAAWFFVGSMMWLGRRHMRRLNRFAGPLPEHPPRVTILIPAKDEGERVRVCLDSVLSQDYPNLEIITIDDRSTDDTGRILDEIAAASNGPVRSLHIEQGGLPPGWLGKCHALHVGAKHATGEWLLFVDSDVKLKRTDALSKTLAACVLRGYDAMSILTSIECETFFEHLVLPLTAGAWSVMNTISYTNNDNRKDSAYANGQFFLIRRSTYDAAGGHEFVKDQIVEDVELARRMKAQGAKVRLEMGKRFASTRMHATLPQMFRGWARIYSGTSRRRPGRLIALALYLLVCGFSVYAALALALVRQLQHSPAARGWWIASLAHLAFMTVTLFMIYSGARGAKRYALLFPVGGAILLSILVYAIRWCITGRIEWRGTVFQQSDRPSALPR
jgi:glycosyltransferase involved in cell wall biosynthesis